MSRIILVSLLFALPILILAQDQDPDPVPDQEQPPAEEAPAEDAPAEDAPAEEAPADEPPVPQPPFPQPPVPQPPIPQPRVVPPPPVGPPGILPPVPDPDDQIGEPRDPLLVPVQPGLAAPDPDIITDLNFENMTMLAVAELYNQYTGKIVMVSDEASASEIKIVLPGKLTYAQAAILLEKKLALEGYSLIQDADVEMLMKLVLSGSPGAGVKLHDLDLLDDLSLLDGPADRVITYVMALEFLKPDEALRAFQTVVQTFGTAGTVASVPNAGAVVITANIPLVRTLVKLKERIDVPAARVGTKFVEVTYADVEELSDKLNEIFNSQQQQQRTAGVQRTGSDPVAPPIPTLTPPIPPTGAPAGPTAAADASGGGSAGEETPIYIIPHSRTSRIFLMGRPVDIVFVEGLIEDFDAPSSKRNFLRLKLSYLPVTEFIPVAADALERTLETGGAGGVGGAGGTTARRTGGLGATGGQRTNQLQLNQTANQTGGLGGTGGTGGSRAQVPQQEFNTAPESILVGKTLLVGDNISNSIVVNGPPHHIEIIEDLVRELDQPSEQVAITAVFARYDLTKGRSFGLDLVNLLDNVTEDVRAGFSYRNNTPGVVGPDLLETFANAIAASGGAMSSSGLSAYGFFGDNFGVFVNALEANSKFTAISRPTVFTTNNGVARISSGSRIAVPTSTFQGGTATGQSTNIEFRDIVLELEVQPLVNSDDEVTLQISLVRDAIGQNRSIVGVGDVPDIDTEEIATTVTVPNRATIVLGGLITEEDSRNKTGLPILSGIPGIGWLFGSGSHDVAREELVILIHPSILSTRQQLYQYQQEFDAINNVSQQARASVEGANAILLPARGTYSPKQAYPPNAGGVLQVQHPQVYQEVYPEAAPQRGVVTSPSQQALRNKRGR